MKNAEPSHIPGLSKDSFAEAAKKALKKDRKKEKKKETPKPNPKTESKTLPKEKSTNAKEGNIFINLKADDSGDNDNDWTWAPPEKTEESPSQIMKTPSFKSATEKKVEKEEKWKLALEKQNNLSRKRVATSPLDGQLRPRGKSTSSGMLKLDFSSQ